MLRFFCFRQHHNCAHGKPIGRMDMTLIVWYQLLRSFLDRPRQWVLAFSFAVTQSHAE